MIKESENFQLIIQYIVVGIIILSAIAWTIIKRRNRKKDHPGGCAGCSLAESCNKKKKQ